MLALILRNFSKWHTHAMLYTYIHVLFIVGQGKGVGGEEREEGRKGSRREGKGVGEKGSRREGKGVGEKER